MLSWLVGKDQHHALEPAVRTELDFSVKGSSCLDPVLMGAASGGEVFSSWLHLETVSLGRDFSTHLGRIWLLSGEHVILGESRSSEASKEVFRFKNRS